MKYQSIWVSKFTCGLALASMLAITTAMADEAKPAAGKNLAKSSQNPISSLISVPFENNSNFKKKPWDIAAYIYQVLWQVESDHKRHVSLFVGGTGGPDNPQFAQWNIFAAVEAIGPMASRAHDRMGVSGWYNGLSNDFTDLTSDLGIRLRDLWGVELYYNAAITPAIHVTPDIQFLENENKGDDPAIVPGVRLTIDF